MCVCVRERELLMSLCVSVVTHAKVLSLPLPVKLVGACVLPSFSLLSVCKIFQKVTTEFGWNLVNRSLAHGSVDVILAVTSIWDSCHCKCFVVFVTLTAILFYVILGKSNNCREFLINVQHNIAQPPITVQQWLILCVWVSLNTGHTVLVLLIIYS